MKVEHQAAPQQRAVLFDADHGRSRSGINTVLLGWNVRVGSAPVAGGGRGGVGGRWGRLPRIRLEFSQRPLPPEAALGFNFRSAGG